MPFSLPVQITAESLPSVTVTGLPAGLKATLDVVAGGEDATFVRITGVPTTPTLTAPVKLTVPNVATPTKPASATFFFTVDPLPNWRWGRSTAITVNPRPPRLWRR